MDRRLDAQPGGAVAPVYNPVYSEAFVLDPYYADVDESPDSTAQRVRCPPHTWTRRVHWCCGSVGRQRPPSSLDVYTGIS
jgi:hypothetical protein